jgi:hypothetical protein
MLIHVLSLYLIETLTRGLLSVQERAGFQNFLAQTGLDCASRRRPWTIPLTPCLEPQCGFHPSDRRCSRQLPLTTSNMYDRPNAPAGGSWSLLPLLPEYQPGDPVVTLSSNHLACRLCYLGMADSLGTSTRGVSRRRNVMNF